MTQIFGLLAVPLGYIMQFLYSFLLNYGWTIIVFTFIIRIVLFPLSLIQQKGTARMSAYQPMIQELQKKWANDRRRQNEEMQKFYQENNIKMTAGCAPMLVNMLVIFGIIAVIQAPVKYIIGMPDDQLQNATVIVAEHREDVDAESRTNYSLQSIMIGDMKAHPEWFEEGNGTTVEGKPIYVEDEWIKKVTEFNFEFLGLNLAERPSLNFNRYLIMPILSVLTMVGSQVIMMKTGGTQPGQSKNTMWIMTIVMGVMFGWFAFTVPVGFSLYYTASNIVMTLQQLVLRQIYNPAKIREEVEREMEAKRKMKKTKKKITIKEKNGYIVERELSEAELAKLRLAKAREMDAAQYTDEEAEPKKALPEAKAPQGDSEEKDDEPTEILEENAPENTADAEPGENGDEDEDREAYKPGRRKRARMNKEQKEADDNSLETEQVDEAE